jgi:hypothetical protein
MLSQRSFQNVDETAVPIRVCATELPHSGLVQIEKCWSTTFVDEEGRLFNVLQNYGSFGRRSYTTRSIC